MDKFIETLSKGKDSYLAKIDGSKCKDLDSLFSEFKQAFKFPDYFGYNWAAFDECLNDLDWIDAESYVLVIKNMTEILPDDNINFDRFLKYLYEALTEWTEGRDCDDFPTEKKPFHIYFHSSEENKKVLIEKVRGNFSDE
ncbi:barstar family protein [Methanosarcina sp. 2.H.T.1A.8]|uniref:barstar family protein n=1 Tax=Methanosarcina sp. 2.H.T.1A.8 TaxID=1483598 RepID=UPI001F1959A3|nr:barstar family protein [Methanosarcina sp. 2.H.T.1A.8]